MKPYHFQNALFLAPEKHMNIIAPLEAVRESPTMHPNFCSQCGARLTLKGWRGLLHGSRCDSCSRRIGHSWRTPLVSAAIIAAMAFALGRYLRPAPPPLIIQRMANSPLSDLPVNQLDSESQASTRNSSLSNANTVARVDEEVYICGARTKKGTPCHRRVHSAGERCFQHKGMPAILPLEKLVIAGK